MNNAGVVYQTESHMASCSFNCRRWTLCSRRCSTSHTPSPPCSLAPPSTPASTKCSRTSKLRWEVNSNNNHRITLFYRLSLGHEVYRLSGFPIPVPIHTWGNGGIMQEMFRNISACVKRNYKRKKRKCSRQSQWLSRKREQLGFWGEVYDVQMTAAVGLALYSVIAGPVVALLQRHHWHHRLVHAGPQGR